MGLLDNFLGTSMDDPKTMAVMNMAAGLLGGGNFGQALGRGLGGYSETMGNAKKQALLDEQMQWKRDEMAREKQQREQQSNIEKLIRDSFLPTTGPQAIAGDALGPTVSKVQNIGQTRPIDYQALAVAGATPERLKSIADASNLGKSKVARTVKGVGPDGREYEYQVDEFGNKVGDGLAQFRAPVMQDLGGQVVALDQYTMKPMAQFGKTMTPDGQASNAVAWANNSLSRERLNFDKQGGADGVMGAKLPPSYMWAAPGQAVPIPGTEAAQKAALANREKQSAIDNAKGALTLVDQAIAHPGRTTATGLSSVLDPRNYVPGTQAKDFQAIKDQISGGAFLQAFESLKGGGAITEVEGKKAEQAIARMQTSQSDQAFEQALRDYRGVIETGMKRMNGAPQQTSPMSFDAGKESRYQMWKKSQGLQ